jgi:hypothetical protein
MVNLRIISQLATQAYLAQNSVYYLPRSERSMYEINFIPEITPSRVYRNQKQIWDFAPFFVA